MKLLRLLSFFFVAVAGVAHAKPSSRGRSSTGTGPKKVAAKENDNRETPAPAPAAALPTHYNGPNYATAAPPAPAPAPGALAIVNPKYQDLLNQFVGLPEWAEQRPNPHLNRQDNVEHDPAYHWTKFWPALQGMDEETRSTFMKWMITSDMGMHSFSEACESMIDLEAKNRRAEAEKIAADVLKAEENKVESEFSPRTTQGRADMLRVCRDTFAEKLELDLDEAEAEFKQLAKLQALASSAHSSAFGNPDDATLAKEATVAAAAVAAAILSHKNKKKRRGDDNDEEQAKKKPKKSGEGGSDEFDDGAESST